MSLSGMSAAGVSVSPRLGHPLRTPVLWVLTGGVLLGVIGRLVLPAARAISDRGEVEVAADASFFLLAAAAGLITAIVLVARPGIPPALRLGVVLVASLVASVLAAGLCWLLGGPLPAAWGNLLVWPASTAFWVATTTIARLLFRSP